MDGRQGTRSDQTLLLDIWSRLAVVEQQNVQMLRSQVEADVSRRVIHERLNDLSAAAEIAKRLEPTVIELDRMRQQAVGMQILIKAFWAVMGAMAAIVGTMVEHWLGKPH